MKSLSNQIVLLLSVMTIIFLLGCSDQNDCGKCAENTIVVIDTISELNYVKNQFFYLDTIFKKYAEGQSIAIPQIETEKIQIFKRLTGGIPPNEDIKFAYFGGDMTQVGAFVRLIAGNDYEFDIMRPGVIRFTNKLNENDVIGVISTINGLEKSDTSKMSAKIYLGNRDTTIDAYKDLWILKNEYQRVEDPTYNLMLRNVYYIGMSEPANFDLKVFRILPDNSKQEQNDFGEYFTDILGLSQDGVLYRDHNNFYTEYSDNLEFYSYIHIPSFPATEGLNSNWVFTNPKLGMTVGRSNINSMMYDDAISHNAQQLYKIIIKRKISF